MLRRQLEMGCSVESILEFMVVTGGAEKRRAADEAIHCYQRAVTELRALMMQALVAESGVRVGEVAPEDRRSLLSGRTALVRWTISSGKTRGAE